MLRSLLIGCLLCVCPATAQHVQSNSKTIYVDSGKIHGQNTGADTSNAFTSVLAAMKTPLSAGDTIFVRDSHMETLYKTKCDMVIPMAIGLMAGLCIGLFVGMALGRISAKEPFEYTRIVKE